MINRKLQKHLRCLLNKRQTWQWATTILNISVCVWSSPSFTGNSIWKKSILEKREVIKSIIMLAKISGSLCSEKQRRNSFGCVVLCRSTKQSKHLQTALRRRWFHTRLKIKPRAGEWLSMSVWNDNRKCGLVLGLYRSRLKMFKRININASTSALHAEPTTAEEKTFCISWCASPLHLKPYTQTALGSSLCSKPWLSQQGTLRTVGE